MTTNADKLVADSVPQLDLSICIVAHYDDAHWMPKMLSTLPRGAEVIILFNGQGDADVCEFKETKQISGHTIHYYDWKWTEFDFSTARNKCIAYASRGWILWLDCDDRLLIPQHEFFTKLSNYPPGVGGLMCGVIGVQPPFKTGDKTLRYHSQQVRLFRNHHGFQFELLCHEQIGYSIERAGMQVPDCSLLIHHEGYQIDADAMYAKMVRNVNLLTKQWQLGAPNQRFLLELLVRDASNLLQLHDQINGANNGTS